LRPKDRRRNREALNALIDDITATMTSAALVGQPFTLSRTPIRLVSGAPEYGEHTDAILAEFGYSADDIARLRKGGVI